MKIQSVKRKFDYVNHIYIKLFKIYNPKENNIKLDFLLKYGKRIKKYSFTIPNNKSYYNDMCYRLQYNFPKRKFFSFVSYERRYD